MRFRFTAALVLVAIVISTAGARAAGPRAQSGLDWQIDPARSEVRFTVTKLGFSDVTGLFHDSEGSIYYDEDRPEVSRVQWRVRVASVKTDASTRDSTLQQPEYFDAAHHPYLEFASRSVRELNDGRLEVAGQITMRGVTRPLTLAVRIQTGSAPRFETDFTVDRYDFGITGGSVMGRLIGRTVRVHLVAAVRPRAGINGGVR
ncbi:MAG TPA: YceI family protein [Vicinamibacterales bacterium]|nr:YceI family protein [Vicinamibacterales bacterium]